MYLPSYAMHLSSGYKERHREFFHESQQQEKKNITD